MIVKKEFSFLKNIPNLINIPVKEIESLTDDLDLRNLSRSLLMMERKFSSHFTSNKIYKMISDIDISKKNISIVKLEQYPLPVTVNIPSQTIVINLSYSDGQDINRLSSKEIYSYLVYGYCLRELVNFDMKIKLNFAEPIINFLMSVFIRLFGKQYGLLGSYQYEISKVKFLLSCYVYRSFFGVDKKYELYNKAETLSTFRYNDIIDLLSNYEFYDIDDLINSLSKTSAMPGLTKYEFASKCLKFLGLNFICGIEDFSRFISLISASNINGTTLIPSYFYKYNVTEYQKLLTISQMVFK